MNWTKHNALSLIKTTQQCRNRKEKSGTRNAIIAKNKLDTRGQPGIEPGPHQIQISHSYKNRSKIPNGA